MRYAAYFRRNTRRSEADDTMHTDLPGVTASADKNEGRGGGAALAAGLLAETLTDKCGTSQGMLVDWADGVAGARGDATAAMCVSEAVGAFSDVRHGPTASQHETSSFDNIASIKGVDAKPATSETANLVDRVPTAGKEV